MPKKKKKEDDISKLDSGLSKEEQELVITMDRAGGCQIYCSWPKHIKKYAEEYPEDYKITSEDEYAVFAEVNPKLILYKKPYRSSKDIERTIKPKRKREKKQEE